MMKPTSLSTLSRREVIRLRAPLRQTHRCIASYAHAGPSRLPFVDPASLYTSRKGKERQRDIGLPSSIIHIPRHCPTRLSCTRAAHSPFGESSKRAFHTTARRDAIPLIPATIGILKSTSVLTAVTAISRILISFFPIGTLATFKFARKVNWVSENARRPEGCDESEEFYKMWCQDEKGRRVSIKEAREILAAGSAVPDGGLLGPDGRITYAIPMPPSRWGTAAELENPLLMARQTENGKDRTKQVVRYIHHTRFFMPELPPAAVPYYERLAPEERSRVDALRKYWISVKMFKDSLRTSRWIMATLFFLPFIMVAGVYVCGLERVPLTGRWRIILLTPEEEDTISSSLAGANWYRSVINLLTTEERPAPPIVPYEDWRWRWVEGVLRRLENGALAECHGRPPPYGLVVPVPPAQQPLKPRPRVSSMLHSVLPGGEPASGREHLDIGPPYSLMIMEKEERNAFSYGFGGKGAGGVVVYTGLLDSILREGAPIDSPLPPPKGFFGGLFSSEPLRRAAPIPTETQTLHLACVLAHEMGHLLLSHHLETLSQQQVLWPSILGLTMDLARAFIWPFTFILGPTVNDALANMGRTSTEEMSERYGQVGFQWKHEYEADLAGLRILALAGFDPNAAIEHFSQSVADLDEIRPVEDGDGTLTGRMFKLWTWATHPTPEQRNEAIREEMKRWSNVEGKEQVK